jgi:dolichol-phosphate mannosyltransferase
MKVSVILPTYEEAGNIVDLIRAIIESFPAGWEHEIVVADDNSPDQTFEVVKAAFEGNPGVVPLLRTTDRGLAKAIRAGIEVSRGEQILVMDSDFTLFPQVTAAISPPTFPDVAVGLVKSVCLTSLSGA